MFRAEDGARTGENPIIGADRDRVKGGGYIIVRHGEGESVTSGASGE